MRAYVLIEAAVGTSNSIVSGIGNLASDDVKLVSADVVTGPYDAIVMLEANDLDQLARFVTDKVQAINGVQRTLTCVA
ncbi:MAG: Lrp/AsnC family transcriptional regulator [Chloroflexi bacterium]|nr:MAG: Lrp/AsnC family transcriptional regulator [Chloroflexota bacterium]